MTATNGVKPNGHHVAATESPLADPIVIGRGSIVAIDLCCGLGGFSFAARSIGIQPLFGVDTNQAALKTYRSNFPDAKTLVGSITTAATVMRCKEIGDAASCRGGKVLVLSGPPCQGFSAAGSRDPDDPRNDVIVAVARAVVSIQPDAALIENVAAILAAKHKSRVDRFKRILKKGGYSLTAVLLDAATFGVAQRRKRAFFLITKVRLSSEAVLQALKGAGKPPIGTLKAFAGLPPAAPRAESYNDDSDPGTLANHVAMRHSEKVIAKILALEPGSGPMSYRKLHPARPSPTLMSGHRAPPAHYAEGRSITVREAARLQGLPDTFRVYGPFANQMEQVSNAVPPPLAAAVLGFLVSQLEDPQRASTNSSGTKQSRGPRAQSNRRRQS